MAVFAHSNGQLTHAGVTAPAPVRERAQAPASGSPCYATEVRGRRLAPAERLRHVLSSPPAQEPAAASAAAALVALAASFLAVAMFAHSPERWVYSDVPVR